MAMKSFFGKMAYKTWHIGDYYLIVSPCNLQKDAFPTLAVLASFGKDVGPSELVYGPSRASLGHLLRHLPGDVSWLMFLSLWLGGKRLNWVHL